MANTITNFLVGIGFDFDQKGAKEVDSAIDGVKSRALQLGAVLAGAFGIKAMTTDFANAYDELGRFSRVLGVTPQEVYNLGGAFQSVGGDIQTFMTEIQGLERIRAAALKGDFSIFREAGISGADASVIMNAKNATEAYIALAGQFQNMSTQQRLNVAEAFGLSREAIELLSMGPEKIRAMMVEEEKRNANIMAATKVSRQFNMETHELFKNLGGIADTISVKLVPEITNIISGMNDWIDANRELIDVNLDEWLKPIADNFGLIATAGTALAAGGTLKFFTGLSGVIPGVASGISAIAAGLTGIATAGTIGLGAYNVIDNAIEDAKQIETASSASWRQAEDFKQAQSNLEGMGWSLQKDQMPVSNGTSKSQNGSSVPNVNLNIINRTDGTMVKTTVERTIQENNNRTMEELQSSTGG